MDAAVTDAAAADAAGCRAAAAAPERGRGVPAAGANPDTAPQASAVGPVADGPPGTPGAATPTAKRSDERSPDVPPEQSTGDVPPRAGAEKGVSAPARTNPESAATIPEARRAAGGHRATVDVAVRVVAPHPAKAAARTGATRRVGAPAAELPEPPAEHRRPTSPLEVRGAPAASASYAYPLWLWYGGLYT